MLDLPARISPLGFLDLYPQLKECTASHWLKTLEHSIYASGDAPPLLSVGMLREIKRMIRTRSLPASRPVTAREFGRIGSR